jgi:succinate dehydrogenase/fumarate reductase flavoprotein subunit
MKLYYVTTTAWITKGRRITTYEVHADDMAVLGDERGSPSKVLIFTTESGDIVATFSDWDVAWLNTTVVVQGKEEEPDVEGTGTDQKDWAEAEAEA